MKKLLLALLISSTTFAGTANAKISCPSIDAIRAVNLSQILVDKIYSDRWYGAVAKDKFETKNTWSFLLGEVTANSEIVAKKKLNSALHSVFFIQGPIEMDGETACFYGSRLGERSALVITPPIDVQNPQLNFR